MIVVTNSCGDCGYASGVWEDFQAHHQRDWHRVVKRIGLHPALASKEAGLPDAERAVALFPQPGEPPTEP